MAAASNKSVGLQITIAIFALLTVVFLAMWWVTFDDLKQSNAATAKASQDLKTEQNLTREQDTQIQQLKQVTGRIAQVVGTIEQAGDETVVGQLLKDIAKAPGQARTTAEAITVLSDQVTRLEQELKIKDTSIEETRKTITENAALYQQQVDSAVAARDTAVRDKENALKSKAEEIQSKQRQIDDLTREKKELQTEYDEAKDSWTNERKKFEAEIAQYNDQIDKLRERLKNLTRESYEVPDGFVRWVDNTTRTVSINLGSADGLRVRTSFSVYRKEHNGVGRGAEDIKGQIEVTRVTGAHQAEARILADDIYQPMAKGDPIYTPLWSPGRAETFAIVGLIDLDRDGISDRERFHDMVLNTGATLTQEVLDDGKRIMYRVFPSEWTEWTENDAQIDSDTKFLIIGTIPDPALAVRDEDKQIRTAISGQLKAMRDEARRLGVTEIRLNDFLEYIGYKPERRLYVPGETERPFNLKNGAASSTTGESVGDRSSAGEVSGRYTRSKRLKPQGSEGSYDAK